jgi:hypothetical protein
LKSTANVGQQKESHNEKSIIISTWRMAQRKTFLYETLRSLRFYSFINRKDGGGKQSFANEIFNELPNRGRNQINFFL